MRLHGRKLVLAPWVLLWALGCGEDGPPPPHDDDGGGAPGGGQGAGGAGGSAGVDPVSCEEDTQCDSGLCLDPNGDGDKACRSACPGLPANSSSFCADRDCGAGLACGPTGWFCWSLDGETDRMCRCDLNEPGEPCNGWDDDCNGVVDDPETADPDCEAELGPGASCDGGQCLAP